MRIVKALRIGVIFLLIAVLVAALNYTFYTSLSRLTLSAENDSVTVNLASRQSTTVQQIAKVLLLIQDALARERSISSLMLELETSHNAIEDTLNALANGGTVTALDGSEIFLSAAPTPGTVRLVEQARRIWDPYSRDLQRLLDIGDSATEKDIRRALSGARSKTNPLAAVSTKISAELELWARQNANRQQTIVIAVTIVVLNALLVVVVLTWITVRRGRRLQKTTDSLAAAKQQTDSILGTIEEGLLLIDSGHIIGEVQSKETGTLLQQENLDGQNLLKYLKPLITEETYSTAVDYVGLVFNDRVKEKLISDLNPLAEVEINFPLDDGAFDTRYYSFHFNRVVSKGEITQALVTISDISKRVVLAQQLQRFQEEAQEQVGLIFNIVHVPPTELQNFIKRMQSGLDQINEALKADRGIGSHHATLNEIFRIAHVIKGDAGVLGIDFFESKLHLLETLVSDLRSTQNLTGNDFLQLTVMLDDLYDNIHSIKQLISRLTVLRDTFEESATQEIVAISNDSKKVPMVHPVQEAIESIARRVSTRQEKSIHLDWSGFDSTLISPDIQESLRDILVQLVRNTITHGMESREQRLRKGKHPVGTLHLKNWKTDSGTIRWLVEDDGTGLQVDKIKKRALEKGLVSPEKVVNWTRNDVVKAIFSPGFSSADNVDKDAGRGIGLDTVRDILKQRGGKIRVSWLKDKFCQFCLELPATVAK